MPTLREMFEKEMNDNLSKMKLLLDEINTNKGDKEKVKQLDDVLHAMDGIALQVDNLKMVKILYNAKLILDKLLDGSQEVNSNVILQLVRAHDDLLVEVNEVLKSGKSFGNGIE